MTFPGERASAGQHIRGTAVGWIILTLPLLFGSGCANPSRDDLQIPALPTQVGPDPEAYEISIFSPFATAFGRILSVHDEEYVIVDFALNRFPEPGEILEVYRDKERVGEIEASRFRRNFVYAARILAGEPKAGDEVRGKSTQK